MNEKFYDLAEEKQLRMINAGLEVFGSTDYRHASTDDIAAKAGISKGLLFYYFKNKKEFYVFLFDYCADFFRNQVVNEKFKTITDFFELLEYASQTKYSVIVRYPHMMNFVVRAWASRREEVSETMNGKVGGTLSEVFEVYFQNVDFSRFCEEADPRQLLKMLTWMAEGYIQDKLRHSEALDIDELMKDFREWEDMFRKIAYKEEVNNGSH